MVQILRYAALAEEATYDESPVPSPDFWADIASASLDTPSDTELEYEGGLSRGLRLHRSGFYAPSGNIVYADGVNTLMRAFRWALGGYAFTAGPPNTHEAYAIEDVILPSFHTRIGKDVFEHQFSGCALNSLQIAVEDNFVQATLDVAAARDLTAALDLDVIDKLEDVPPFVFHEVTSSIATVDESALIRALTLTIENGLDISAGRSIGSRHPRRAPVGNRRVNVEMTLWYENTEQIERVWGDPAGPVVGGSTEFPVDIDMDAGADGSVNIQMPRVIWTNVSTQPSGQSRIEQTVNGRAFLETIALADATDVRSEVLATVTNAIGDVTA